MGEGLCICVHIYVCIYVCMYVCMYVYVYICLSIMRYVFNRESVGWVRSGRGGT